MIRILGTVFAALVGLAFGSFLNVCLSRWPAGESVVAPRSHCRGCGRTLAWWENVPLVSWIAFRGRCRTCGVWIGWRYPLVELAVAGLWSAIVWGFLLLAADPNVPAISPFLHWNLYNSLGRVLALFLFSWILVGLAVLDAERFWLPDRLTVPGILTGFLSGQIYAAVSDRYSDGPSPSLNELILSGAVFSIGGILAAAIFVLVIRWAYWLIRRREGIGLGDAKLMAMLAAWLGLPGALLAFAIGVVLGALAGVAILLRPKLRQDSESLGLTKLPLGTFLCIGGIVSCLWGQPIIAAYLRWAGFD
jgi:leader peptidase (prepilin peptidase)/N-methyltransferase